MSTAIDVIDIPLSFLIDTFNSSLPLAIHIYQLTLCFAENLYRNCSESEFRCKNQKCVQGKWRCDQDDDCGDGSDEDPEFCHSKSMHCSHRNSCYR